MYKKSDFNIVVETMDTGSKLVFNTITCVLGIMDPETQSLYNNIEGLELDLVNNSKSKEAIETMYKMGFIIQKNINELEVLKTRDAISRFTTATNTMGLTIATSLDCNMACTYCYEGKSAINKIAMDSSVQNDVVNFVGKCFENSNIKHFSVCWYGGEPLLNKEAIYELSKSFLGMCAEKEVHYSGSIVTNGVLLDYETAKRLKTECDVTAAQVTLDGMPEHHNAKRIFLNGAGSFETIVNNIEASKEFLRIAVRVNVDKENLLSGSELTEYFTTKGWGDNPMVYISPVRDYGNCNYNTSCILSDMDFAKFQTKAIEERYATDKSCLTQVYPKRIDNYCGAQRINNFVIDPEGYLYTCWNNVGIIEKSFGDVRSGLVLNENYTNWLLSEPAPKCYECPFLPICQGGCPHDYQRTGVPTCLNWINDYKSRLKLAYRDHQSKKNNAAQADNSYAH